MIYSYRISIVDINIPFIDFLAVCSGIQVHSAKMHDMNWIFVLLFLAGQTLAFAQQVAFTLPDKFLVPECIAWSYKQKKFYVTSIHRHKIVTYDPVSGQTMDFIESGQEGYDGGIGLIIDEKRNRLWSACGSSDGKTYTTGIYAFDLSSGKLLHKYLSKDTIPSLFNDLALDRNGNVYITNTYESRIYFFNTKLNAPRVYLEDIEYPNGISIGPKQSLFIASHTKGILKVNLRTKQVIPLDPGTLSTASTGIDGLKYYKNSLIGVRNATQDIANNKLLRYYLTRKKDKISSVEIMDEKNPHFLLPTTGVIVNGTYYLIANSNLTLLDQQSNTFPDKNMLKETVILKYKL